MTVCFCRPHCVFCILESYSASLIHSMYVEDKSHNIYSGGFKNLEREVQPLAHVAKPKILRCHAHFRSRKRPNWISRSNFGLVKCLEISKELIHECLTMLGRCCCIPLLYNHLMDSCSYSCKNTLLAAKGGCICTPLTLPESATDLYIV